tara:strand:+ start:4532 stop:5029 length:498 start_codon:yes stop_codon:yes gene_type:complete
MSEEKTIEPDVKQENDTKVENNVPITRLNEVISERNTLREEIQSFKESQDDQKRAKLQEEEKWQELNTELVKEVENYKPYKDKWDSMDKKLREDALARLPESKREKFSNVDTQTLLSIVDEFTVAKENPPDRQGTVPTDKLGKVTDMSLDEKKRNWGQILESYRR